MSKKKKKTEDDFLMDTGLTISKCYKCTDLEVFEDYEEAKEHQLRLNFCENLQAHLEELDYPTRDNQVATDIIMADLNGLAEIFQDYINMRGE